MYRSAPIRPVLTVVAVQFQLGAPLAAAATLVVCAAFLVGTAASPGLTVWDGVLSFHAVGWLIAAGRRDITVLRRLELGVSTYLTKAEGREHLIPALHAAARDLPYVSPALGGVMAGDRRGSTSTTSDALDVASTGGGPADRARPAAPPRAPLAGRARSLGSAPGSAARQDPAPSGGGPRAPNQAPTVVGI